MKIPQFLASLLPTFSKNRIVEDINVTYGEITEYTHPAYAIAAPDFKCLEWCDYLGSWIIVQEWETSNMIDTIEWVPKDDEARAISEFKRLIDSGIYKDYQ